MTLYFKGVVTLGFVGADRSWEVEVPEDWDEMTEQDREGWMSDTEQEMADEYAESYGEIVER